MADATTSSIAQAQALGDQLLSELQAAVPGKAPASSPASAISRIKDAGMRARQRIAQAAEDGYWAPRRQIEQAIAARQQAGQQAAVAEERIAQIKQQLGT